MNLSKGHMARATPINYGVTLFLVAICIILILLPLFQKGTFIDGQLYKTVAFNDAIHAAGFWNMKYTNTCMSFFCEQPPLYSFLLGCFYNYFGSGYLIDRLFTLLLLALFLFLTKVVITSLFSKAAFYNSLFIFFMLSVPVWCWSYVNQVIEPLVCIFTIAGIWCFVKYITSKNLLYCFLFCILIYLSFLSKGFQSCFLIVLPLTYFLIAKVRRQLFSFVLISAVLVGLSLWLTLKCYAPAAAWFQCYYHARLILTMQNVGGTTNDHFEIIVRFFTELIIPFAVMIILFFYLTTRKKYPLKIALKNFMANKLAVAFLITALAGSLPYAVSLVQRGFYLVPSFVCFLLAILLGFKRYWLFFAAFINRLLSYRISKPITILMFTGSLVYFALAFNSYKRDEGLLTDIEKMQPYLKEKDTVLIKGDLWNYFNLHSCLYMSKQVSLIDDAQQHDFMILTKTQVNTDTAYTRLELGTKDLNLFKRH